MNFDLLSFLLGGHLCGALVAFMLGSLLLMTGVPMEQWGELPTAPTGKDWLGMAVVALLWPLVLVAVLTLVAIWTTTSGLLRRTALRDDLAQDVGPPLDLYQP